MTPEEKENSLRAVALVTEFISILRTAVGPEDVTARSTDAMKLLLEGATTTDLILTITMLSSIGATLAIDGRPEDATALLRVVAGKFV